MKIKELEHNLGDTVYAFTNNGLGKYKINRIEIILFKTKRHNNVREICIKYRVDSLVYFGHFEPHQLFLTAKSAIEAQKFKVDI